MADAPEAIPDDEFERQQREHYRDVRDDDDVDDVFEDDNDSDVNEEPKALTITDPGAGDTAQLLSDMNLRLERIENTQNALKEGVNLIGGMMNQVAEAFDQIMQKVQTGGIGALLGGMMGGQKNDG